MDKARILAGRKAVDAYRTAHTKLYDKGWYKGISENHTPLLDTMVVEFNKKGFNSIREFFDASDLLNIQELGFADRGDFEARVKGADKEALDRMWV